MLVMKKTIFVGQAMPRIKHNSHDWPSLNSWLHSIGLTDDLIKQNTFFSALVDYFPGAINGTHIVPSKEEIEKERDRLRKTIKDFGPEIVVPVGRLSISYCLNQNVQSLTASVGKKYKTNPYNLYTKELLVIPLPHPSGASTWRYKKENKELLDKALFLLKQNIY
jgi:uracil-DNA glycosylase